MHLDFCVSQFLAFFYSFPIYTHALNNSVFDFMLSSKHKPCPARKGYCSYIRSRLLGEADINKITGSWSDTASLGTPLGTWVVRRESWEMQSTGQAPVTRQYIWPRKMVSCSVILTFRLAWSPSSSQELITWEHFCGIKRLPTADPHSRVLKEELKRHQHGIMAIQEQVNIWVHLTQTFCTLFKSMLHGILLWNTGSIY